MSVLSLPAIYGYVTTSLCSGTARSSGGLATGDNKAIAPMLTTRARYFLSTAEAIGRFTGVAVVG